MEWGQMLLAAAKMVLIMGGCMLMSIGFADIIIGIRSMIWRKKRTCLFAVIPVRDADMLETDISAARSALERAGCDGEILLADHGADDVAKEVCSRFYGDVLSEREIAERMMEVVKRR